MKNIETGHKSLWRNILYYFLITVLIVALGLMYVNWNRRQSQFLNLRKQISQTEEITEIQARRADEEASDTEVGSVP